MSEQEFILAIVAMVSVASVLSIFVLSLFGYARARLKRKQVAKAEGTSLTTSELYGLMQAAVEEAAAPLVERLAAVEGRLDEAAARPRLEAPQNDDVLETLRDASRARATSRHEGLSR